VLLLLASLAHLGICAEDYYKVAATSNDKTPFFVWLMVFQVLGISKSASDKEIKSAYRQLSKKYHPDKNPYV